MKKHNVLKMSHEDIEMLINIRMASKISYWVDMYKNFYEFENGIETELSDEQILKELGDKGIASHYLTAEEYKEYLECYNHIWIVVENNKEEENA